MPASQPLRIRTISEYHQLRGLPAPEHPLISVIDMSQFAPMQTEQPLSIILDFYSISLKRGFNGLMRYGQQDCDFDEGIMFFMAPGQVFSIVVGPDRPQTGHILFIHPDLLWHTPLARRIRQYEYFGYSVTEALFVSEQEEATIGSLMRQIRHEYSANIDRFSRDIIVAQIELLLTYAERYYQRQFLTRQRTSHQLLEKLEEILDGYFAQEDLAEKGLPTVQAISDALHVSSGYLSSLLRTLTGQTTQQHIHGKLIDKAKQQLSTTDLSVSQIAYMLGFEHPQSFSKLFKSKTNVSPQEFRAGFN